MHGARGVVLMRPGKAEIGEDAVAHEFRGKAERATTPDTAS